jgi:hypothetical protein
MGTSFVEYKGFGFWTRDSYLASWLKALITEMQELPTLEPWQKQMVEHWNVQSTLDGGVMSVDLGSFVTGSKHEAAILTVAESALGHSESQARRTGELFIDLLRGKLRTTVSSPIDYLGVST